MNKDNLLDIGRIQTYSKHEDMMIDHILDVLDTIPGVTYEMDEAFNVYATKGESDAFPCVVAHTDSVFPIEADIHLIEIEDKVIGFNRVTMEQRGVGWDDKVGIFIALEMIREIDNIKVAFFVQEEEGCVGSYQADMNFFLDCGYVIQCDRRDNKDFVTRASGVELSSIEFQDAVKDTMKKYNYEPTGLGGMTDVMALKEQGLSVSAVNLSCGYYEAHMENEYIVLDDVENTLNFVRDIISTLGEWTFVHQVPKVDKYVPAVWHDKYQHIWEEDEEDGEELCSDCYQNKANYDSGLCRACEKSYELEYGLKF